MIYQQPRNRFETVSCPACGRKVARKTRQQRFCSDRCCDYANGQRRTRKAAISSSQLEARTAIKKSLLGSDAGAPGNPLKFSNQTNGLRRQKSGSSIPFNVLGGFRWPDAMSTDPAVLRTIIRREIGGAS
jgi:endogenous inhibitor of DNA gyrase (YacG/DUF329 family)